MMLGTMNPVRWADAFGTPGKGLELVLFQPANNLPVI